MATDEPRDSPPAFGPNTACPKFGKCACTTSCIIADKALRVPGVIEAGALLMAVQNRQAELRYIDRGGLPFVRRDQMFEVVNEIARERFGSAWYALVRGEVAAESLTVRTCSACGHPIPADTEDHTVGHGGRLVGSGNNRRAAREGAVVCDGCWEPDPPAATIDDVTECPSCKGVNPEICSNGFHYLPGMDDEDIYLITARAHADKDLEIIGVPTTAALLDAAVRRRAADPRHRAVVDAARDHEFHRTLPEHSRLSALELDTYSDRVETLIAERDAARAEAERIAQDFDDLKRRYEAIVPPTARVAGKRKDVATDG